MVTIVFRLVWGMKHRRTHTENTYDQLKLNALRLRQKDLRKRFRYGLRECMYKISGRFWFGQGRDTKRDTDMQVNISVAWIWQVNLIKLIIIHKFVFVEANTVTK